MTVLVNSLSTKQLSELLVVMVQKMKGGVSMLDLYLPRLRIYVSNLKALA